MLTDINLFINDLLAIQLMIIAPIPLPYVDLEKSTLTGNYIGALTYAYYHSALIEHLTPAQQTLQKAKMTKHYYTAIIHVYNMFEFLGIEQICCTIYINLFKIATLSHHDYQQLVQAALTASLAASTNVSILLDDHLESRLSDLL
ncbi:7488_t:CDS:2 [Cetraspora pellucida]|uniref:7488_t:CDS:1 n=1 Tax=Cetraspora pellucida TaxID=1433469 RepID=A0A9N9FG22_9GLOM|nr:7488_t:CDS:2 [Cetraspora pellucida]